MIKISANNGKTTIKIDGEHTEVSVHGVARVDSETRSLTKRLSVTESTYFVESDFSDEITPAGLKISEYRNRNAEDK
jgi:phage-related protein